jgi:hypothetical protein
VGQELIHVGDEPHELLDLRLALLANLPDLRSFFVEDRVLVVHLDELRLLLDDEGVPVQERRHGGLSLVPV